MIWDLRWHLSQCGSSVLMRSQTTKRQLKTSVHVHRTVSTGLLHTSSCREHFDFSKLRFRILLHTIKDLLTSAISSTFCGTGISTICYGFQVHTAYTTNTSSRSIFCLYFSSTMDSLCEFFPRIRPNQIRTALNGRLNEGLPVYSRG